MLESLTPSWALRMPQPGQAKSPRTDLLWIDPLSILSPTVVSFSRPNLSLWPGLARQFAYDSSYLLPLTTTFLPQAGSMSHLQPQRERGSCSISRGRYIFKSKEDDNYVRGAVTTHPQIFPHLLVKLSFRTTEYIRFYDLLASLGNINLGISSSYDRAKSPRGHKMFENVN